MFFTDDDYKKIRDYLLKDGRGIRDSEFPSTSEVNQEDNLASLQKGYNAKTPMSTIVRFISMNMPSITKKFINDLFDGLVGIPDKEQSQNPDYPAASCCEMFYTEGTSQGDWYLPSCGELGYIMPRFNKIQEAIQKMITAYGSSVGVLNTEQPPQKGS